MAVISHITIIIFTIAMISGLAHGIPATNATEIPANKKVHINYYCQTDKPHVIIENQSSGGLPFWKDCFQISENIKTQDYDDAFDYYNSCEQRKIVEAGSCKFGIEAVKKDCHT